MVIQIRGTSGSGKTTVMRKVMEEYKWAKHFIDGRKNPLFYTAKKGKIAVLGHYEGLACGGCDTIGSARQVFDVMKEVDAEVILAEGLLLSEDTKWALQMGDVLGESLQVVFLTTPLDQCLDRIKQRRSAAGNTKPLNPANTTNRVGVIERARVKLTAANIKCVRRASTQAHRTVLKWVDQASR